MAAAPNDQSSTLEWSNNPDNSLTMAPLQGIYLGKINQNKILTSTSAPTAAAAQSCANLRLEGKTDWYLPSLTELNLMLVSHDTIGAFLMDGTSKSVYWSSTEVDAPTAWGIQFYIGGGANIFDKKVAHQVRCIRAF